MALFEMRGVKLALGQSPVFDGLDLDIHKGEVLTIIGGSGSGKSVLLKTLVGIFPIDEGIIRFDGEVISGLSERALSPMRRRVGMLFQASALFDSMNVRENVAYGLREQFEMSEAEIDARVSEALTAVGLPGIEALWPADLSGGMKKRVALARAVAFRPEVVFYDEPTEGLDPINVTRVNRLLLGLRARLHVTTVVVTHNMKSAFAISDRIAMIADGKIVLEGSPDELRAGASPRLTDFVGRALET